MTRACQLLPRPRLCYLPAREADSAAEGAFLRSFRTGFLTPVDLDAEDLFRAAGLVEQYEDLPLGGTDACVIALAERIKVRQGCDLGREALPGRATSPRRGVHPSTC